MKLQLLVPHYHEPAEVIRPLLDSVAIQQNVDFSEVGVVICHDGEDIPDLELGDYPFQIEQVHIPHGGVSAARNGALDAATADYVMFCDDDDMFFNACGLWMLFREMDIAPFDTMVSVFVEETRDPIEKKPLYVNHEMDSTFVHGKVHRRMFLLENKIRWNPSLTIHEDSYFNTLCQKMAREVKYCPTPFYLWKWRDESVCRHDPKYILKTYNNMLESSTALVKELKERGHRDDAMFYATGMIYDAYFTLNKREWIEQENQHYRKAVEKRFARYFKEHEGLFEAVPEQMRVQIVAGIKNRMYGEGLLMEHITFDDWIKKIRRIK